ncbi:MAG: TrkA family potassium uptake protein [Rikenellaceae bacterium]
MKCIIIGLGNYGSVLAEELTILGHEVIGVDESTSKVEMIKDKVATSFIIDATDEQALGILPLKAVDLVIVAIGENFGASIRVVALLKKYKVEHIYARAVDETHRTVLEAFDLDNIIFPEKDAARSLVQLLDLHVHVESIKIDKEHYVVKLKLPAQFVGYTLRNIALEEEFNLKMIALVRGKKRLNALGITVMESFVDNEVDENYKLEASDTLVCYGRYKDFLSFWRSI